MLLNLYFIALRVSLPVCVSAQRCPADRSERPCRHFAADPPSADRPHGAGHGNTPLCVCFQSRYSCLTELLVFLSPPKTTHEKVCFLSPWQLTPRADIRMKLYCFWSLVRVIEKLSPKETSFLTNSGLKTQFCFVWRMLLVVKNSAFVLLLLQAQSKFSASSTVPQLMVA